MRNSKFNYTEPVDEVMAMAEEAVRLVRTDYMKVHRSIKKWDLAPCPPEWTGVHR